MSKLHSMRKRLQPKKMRIAFMMQKLQQAEPDAKKLRENLPEVFDRTFCQKQQTIEVYAPKGGANHE